MAGGSFSPSTLSLIVVAVLPSSKEFNKIYRVEQQKSWCQAQRIVLPSPSQPSLTKQSLSSAQCCTVPCHLDTFVSLTLLTVIFHYSRVPVTPPLHAAPRAPTPSRSQATPPSPSSSASWPSPPPSPPSPLPHSSPLPSPPSEPRRNWRGTAGKDDF